MKNEELIARLKAASRPDEWLDKAIHLTRSPGASMLDFECGRLVARPYTSSIEAALTLATGDAIDRVGGAIGILRWAVDMMTEAGESIDALPRFICIAALRAKDQADG